MIVLSGVEFHEAYAPLLPEVMVGTVDLWEVDYRTGRWRIRVMPHWTPGEWEPPHRVEFGGESPFPLRPGQQEVRFRIRQVHEVRWPYLCETYYRSVRGVIDGEWELLTDEPN